MYGAEFFEALSGEGLERSAEADAVVSQSHFERHMTVEGVESYASCIGRSD